MAYGCRTGPSGYKGWRADMKTLSHSSQLYPPVSEFGYSKGSPYVAAFLLEFEESEVPNCR
jgi:hypothetical protein